MSTASLRRDHDLIEKVIKAMESTIQLLNDGPGSLTIGFEKDSEANGKAEGNIKGTYGQKKSTGKKRDFLGIDKNDLSDILKNFPIDDKEERARRVAEIEQALAQSQVS